MTSRPSPGMQGVHPSADVLIDLALGELDPERSTAVREHVNVCVRCESTLQQVFADRERARIASASLAVSSEATRNPQSIHARARRPQTRWLVGVAAAAASVLVLFLVPRRPALEPAWLPSSVEGLEPRGTPRAEQDALVWRGLSAYGNRDLDHAVEWLGAGPVADPGLESLRRLHLASAWMLKRDGQRALEAMEGVEIDLLPHPWRGEARWLRACALERLGRRTEARTELERLAADTGDAGERARRALRALAH